jgi:hypothetical protein
MTARRRREPADSRLFASDQRPRLHLAVAELSLRLGRGDLEPHAAAAVGERHRLSPRQRLAVRRCACAEPAAAARRTRRVGLAELRGRPLLIDGFNALITLECALAQATVVVGRDGAHRDLAGIYGAYDMVLETDFVIAAIGRLLADAAPATITWLLDRPVATAERLRARLLALAAAHGWRWDVRLAGRVDVALAAAPGVIATSDAWILDHCGPWIDLLGALLAAPIVTMGGAGPTLPLRPELWRVDLSGADEPERG